MSRKDELINQILEKQRKEELINKIMAKEPQKQEMLSVGGLAQGFKQNIPLATGLLGTALGSGLGPAGMAAGGMLGAALGKSATNLYDYMTDQHKPGAVPVYPGGPEISKTYAEPIEEGLMFGAGEAVGGLMGKGIKRGLKSFQFGKQLKPQKEIEALEELGRREGLEITPGMKTENQILQKLESNIAQSPTITGQKYARNMKKIFDYIESGANELVQNETHLTKFQAGEELVDKMQQKVLEKIKPSQAVFEELKKTIGPNIPINPVSRRRIALNIKKLPMAKVRASTPEAATLNSIAEDLQTGVKNLSDLRAFKTSIGKDLQRARRAGDGNMVYSLGKVYRKLERFEQVSILRAAKDLSDIAGENLKPAARSLIKEVKNANKIYKTQSKDIQALAKAMGIKEPKNIFNFFDDLQDMRPQHVVDKLTNTNNTRVWKTFKNLFPEEYELAKQLKITEIIQNSKVNDRIMPQKVINYVDKIRRQSPEVFDELFTPEQQKVLTNIHLLKRNLPAMSGPSGTPQGLDLMQFLSVSGLSDNFIRRPLQSGFLKASVNNPIYLREISETLDPKTAQGLLKRSVLLQPLRQTTRRENQ